MPHFDHLKDSARIERPGSEVGINPASILFRENQHRAEINMEDGGNGNIGRKVRDSVVANVGNEALTLGRIWKNSPRTTFKSQFSFKSSREDPSTSSVSMTPHVVKRAPEQPPLSPQVPVQRRKSTAKIPSAERWPEHANRTFKWPNAEFDAQKRELEEYLNKIYERPEMIERVPVIGPVAGAAQEWQDLQAGKKNVDLVTAARAVRLGALPYPMTWTPSGIAKKLGVGGALGWIVELAKARSNSSAAPPGPRSEGGVEK